MIGNWSLGARILVVIIDRDRVVRLGPHAVITPALSSEISGQIVVVRPEVERPSHAAGIENKGTQIEVAVIGFVISALHTDENRLRIVPGAAEKRNLDAVKNGVQRPV